MREDLPIVKAIFRRTPPTLAAFSNPSIPTENGFHDHNNINSESFF